MRNPNRDAAQYERPVTLYNVADEPFQAMCGGFTFDLPAEGTFGLFDIWGVPTEQRDGKIVSAGQAKIVMHARDIATHILRKHTPRGIVELTGDKKIDSQRKEEAVKLWTKRKLEQVKREIATWSNYLRVFHADPANKGNYPDPMSNSVSAAYEWRAAYELGLKGGRRKFSCQHDGYQTDDSVKWDAHQRTMHAHDAANAPVEDDEPKVEAPKRGRRPKTLAEAADVAAS